MHELQLSTGAEVLVGAIAIDTLVRLKGKDVGCETGMGEKRKEGTSETEVLLYPRSRFRLISEPSREFERVRRTPKLA